MMVTSGWPCRCPGQVSQHCHGLLCLPVLIGLVSGCCHQWISGILLVLTLSGLLVLLRWGKRREMRMSAEGWREAREKFEEFTGRNANPDASGGDLGLQGGSRAHCW